MPIYTISLLLCAAFTAIPALATTPINDLRREELISKIEADKSKLHDELQQGTRRVRVPSDDPERHDELSRTDVNTNELLDEKQYIPNSTEAISKAGIKPVPTVLTK